MTKKYAVRVRICDEEYTVRSERDPEYTRQVAQYVDQAIRRVLASGTLVETHKAAILACLAITDELFEARKTPQQAEEQIRRMTAELARLIPPGKRPSGEALSAGAEGRGRSGP